MNIYRYFFITALFLIFLSCQEETKQEISDSEGPLFNLLDPAVTGIDFINNVQESEAYNHLLWTHIYSGGGVAIGDINNDKLPDIFFSGNLVGDALYLNQGNMKFKNITQSAGILQDGRWSVGTTFADVNGDGYEDIYVCRMSNSMDPNTRVNLLYINNGNNTFSESATKYGLDNKGFSIQATFFDLDKDGDLDMFLANQPPDPRLLMRFKIDAEQNPEPYLDHLYLNNGNESFTDISKAAGVANYGYGLNVMASDLNNDGWTDLYVSNDYDTPDFLYINNKNKTFTNTINESLKHISNFAMGSDVADYDNDGLLDISVVDMASPDHFRSKTNMGSMRPATFQQYVKDGKHYQYMFNTLQKNNGNGSFSEIGQLAGISKTDWSWGIVMADFDNDGFKDVAITNGIQRDIRNNDFQYKIKKANEAGITQFKILDVVNLVPSNPISNYIYKNNGDLTYTDVTEKWNFNHPGFSNGIAYADLDRDGDLDIVISNLSAPASIYENAGGSINNFIRFRLNGEKGNPNGLNSKVQIFEGGRSQIIEITATRGYMSASEPVAHFGLGKTTKIDSVIITWPNGNTTIIKDVAINKTHDLDIRKSTKNHHVAGDQDQLVNEIHAAENGLNYLQKENDFNDFEREILLPHKQSENGPYLTIGDVNNDSLDDFYIGGAAGISGTLYLQQIGGKFRKQSNMVWEKDKACEDLGCLFFDADNDNDLDLYVVSGGSEFERGDVRLQDRLYLNNGKGVFTKSSLPTIKESGQCVKAGDIDGDGDLDLFVGGRLVPGQYPAPADSYILLNENGKFVDRTNKMAPQLKGLGLVTDAIFADYDQDDDLDLIVVGEWMGITVLENSKGNFIDASAKLGLEKTNGWWWSIESGDLDNDGDLDFVIGNLGANTKFKASADHPFKVYANDFDANGTNDVVLASFYKDKEVPVRGRECSSEQMPFIKDKFPSFEGFANASLDNILPASQLNSAIKYQVQSFKSVILINENGKFSVQPLSVEAQFAPLRDLLVMDINKDGLLDIIGVGNLYQAEVETMRYDAGIGLCLLGEGNMKFKPSTVLESGFFTPYDARCIATLNGGSEILVANNQNKLQHFKINAGN